VTRLRLSALLIALPLALGACGDDSGASGDSDDRSAPPPWQRSESRADCDDFDLLRRPHFGDLHVHTSYSADATIFGTRTTPRDAYVFATGGEIALSDAMEQSTRRAHIDRPLDFAAVTDHSEWLGEVRLCSDPASTVYDIEECRLLRQTEDPGDRFLITVRWLFPAGIPDPPPSLPFCESEGVDCDLAAGSAWEDVQIAAEEAYDRSAACSFTTFVGYENTASLLGRHRHRNVIFRNANVPVLPASQLETDAGGFPQGLWDAIEDDCTGADSGCDAVIIPHNSNLSGGEQFMDPLDRADAQRRQDFEPLVEIFQHKGASECRFDRLVGVGVGSEDELCTFEQLRSAHELPGTPPPSIDEYPARNLVRNALKDGLLFEQELGANPFQMGFIGSTDTHNSTPGNTEEEQWEGAQGSDDATPERRVADNVRNNPGGLAVVWAEENSRDALFAALRRRETYATSGTRPILRFFAGELSDTQCDDRDFTATAYRGGTPMGGEIGDTGVDGGPRFAVLATKDPGSDETPGTDLRRLQIIKGWVDADGQTHERVFEVAGDPSPAQIDPATCTATQPGFTTLCALWQDPDFDPTQHAFYYARLLENPTCRWSTLECRRLGVDPFAADCAAQAQNAGAGLDTCCVHEEDDPFRERVVQERAWSSPIWYRPEAIATIDGGFRFAASGDSLDLDIVIGALPRDADPSRDGFRLVLDDNTEIYTVDLDGQAFVPRADGPGYEIRDDVAARTGIHDLQIELDAQRRANVHLAVDGLDLRTTVRRDHFVRLRLSIGDYRAVQSRLWTATGDSLQSPG